MMKVQNVVSGCCNNPYALAGGVTASYLMFYTAYDKATKTLVPKNLVDLVLCRRGLDWTLVELNKAISLSGMTVMLMSFMPQLKSKSKELLFIAMNMLWGHSVYSFYKFYSFNPLQVIRDKWIKQLSIVLGMAGSVAISAGYWGYISCTNLLLSGTFFGIAHFWTMEVDFKYKLQVRPYAYLPFPMALYNLYNYFVGK